VTIAPNLYYRRDHTSHRINLVAYRRREFSSHFFCWWIIDSCIKKWE